MDLSKQPPRRPSNTGMAGIAGLARMTDKARAHNAELLGEYKYGQVSGLDREVLELIRMDEEAFARAADELDDEALARLVLEKAGRSESEIQAFNKEAIEREPQDDLHRKLLVERVAKYAPGRKDVKTVFQSMELDDWGAFRQVDLTQRPPRSPYVRSVAGLFQAARMADKARASQSGKLGEYRYGEDSGMDRRLLEFLGIGADAFKQAAWENPNDTELSEWVQAHTKRTPGEISALNAHHARRGLHTDGSEYFKKRWQEVCPNRPDIATWFDLNDLDDQQSFRIVDLTRRPPRSPYDAGVAGLNGLARLIDKARAHKSGTLGEYWYGEDSGFDRALLAFLGVGQEEFADAVGAHGTDEEAVAWLGKRLEKPRAEIEKFNHEYQTRGPGNERSWNFLRGRVARLDPSRADIKSFAALTELDDAVTFARLKARV